MIPVDLTINTEVAVKKALELSDEGTIIHLLHVQTYVLPGARMSGRGRMGYRKIRDNKKAASRLYEWKGAIEECAGDIKVCIWILKGNRIQKCIEKKAKELSIDLIIIGKNSYHSWFPFLNTVVPGKLACQTGIAVLTIKPGAIYNKIKTMLVPVSNGSIKHKMEIISTLCRKFRIRIHLVTFMDDQHKPINFYASSLLDIYQWIRTFTHTPVEYVVLHGDNKAKAILDYAEKINADILLVHPETETRIGWMNRHISDLIPPASKMQVLAVQ